MIAIYILMGNHSTQAPSALEVLNFDKFYDIETASYRGRRLLIEYNCLNKHPTNAWARQESRPSVLLRVCLYLTNGIGERSRTSNTLKNQLVDEKGFEPIRHRPLILSQSCLPVPALIHIYLYWNHYFLVVMRDNQDIKFVNYLNHCQNGHNFYDVILKELVVLATQSNRKSHIYIL